jgi:hypothetical protein
VLYLSEFIKIRDMILINYAFSVSVNCQSL